MRPIQTNPALMSRVVIYCKSCAVETMLVAANLLLNNILCSLLPAFATIGGFRSAWLIAYLNTE